MADLSASGLKSKLSKLDPAKAHRVGVGSGLHLLVKAASEIGTGFWVLRFTVAGKRRDMGLGSYPEIGLADARLAASLAKSDALKGADPIELRSSKKVENARQSRDTFRATAEALIHSKEAGWKSLKHRKQWVATLEKHVFPKIGSKPVADVDTGLILDVLRPIWAEVPETASRIRGRIEAVLNYAAAVGLRPRGPNPAAWRGHLSEVLGAPTKLKAAARNRRGRSEHHPSLSYDQMPAFMEALQMKEGVGALATQFVILTAARTGEVRNMFWSEINFDRSIWTIPPDRMKAGKPHFVPLSFQAIELLKSIAPLAALQSGLVFPGRKEKAPLSDMTLSELVNGMSLDGLPVGSLPRWRDTLGNPVVPHGFRATFKAWSLAKGWPDHLSEIALAHTDTNKVRSAYAREPLVEERRPMMQAWAEICCTPHSGVPL